MFCHIQMFAYNKHELETVLSKKIVDGTTFGIADVAPCCHRRLHCNIVVRLTRVEFCAILLLDVALGYTATPFFAWQGFSFARLNSWTSPSAPLQHRFSLDKGLVLRDLAPGRHIWLHCNIVFA